MKEGRELFYQLDSLEGLSDDQKRKRGTLFEKAINQIFKVALLPPKTIVQIDPIEKNHR